MSIGLPALWESPWPENKNKKSILVAAVLVPQVAYSETVKCESGF
jgi:hypothetical protein